MSFKGLSLGVKNRDTDLFTSSKADRFLAGFLKIRDLRIEIDL